MKNKYIKPAMQMMALQETPIICTSDWDVINPGQPNKPAGGRKRRGWEEEDFDEEDPSSPM